MLSQCLVPLFLACTVLCFVILIMMINITELGFKFNEPIICVQFPCSRTTILDLREFAAHISVHVLLERHILFRLCTAIVLMCNPENT